MLTQAIEIRFQEMKELAEQMNTVSQTIRQIGEQKMLEQMEKTKPLWLSETADKFMGKEVRLGVQITAIADNLQKLASMIEKQAQWMYMAEKANEWIAEKRIY